MARQLFSTRHSEEPFDARQQHRPNDAGCLVRGKPVAAVADPGQEEDFPQQQGRDAQRFIQRKTMGKHRQRRVIHHGRRR